MEYDETGWQQGRPKHHGEDEDMPEDNPQETIQECLEKFLTPDYIMEPGIFTQLKRYFQSGGSPEEVIMMLSENYKAVAQMANLLAEWLIWQEYPVVGVGVIRWIENTVTEPSYFKLSTDSCPTHLAILDEVAAVHPTLHQQILTLLIRLFESKQDELEILVQLEMKKMLLDRMVNLLSRGCVVPVVKYIKQCWGKGDTDISLIRYFVTEVLETITHPYSPEFVLLFLPMVENEEITGTMRGKTMILFPNL
ncbi:Negative elongation factor D [Eumeta japonica]|uniref:Negative elongation factor D n=1 Tax=Eumeta variegata TaxID=151549 RepID=A0A4C1T676_EUMVA|nr:Negative elongation factor D [Eumeta japonica]